MFKTAEGSTGRLIQLCLGYFSFYVVFGVATKCFTGKAAVFTPAMTDMEFLVWSSLGGSLICLLVIFAGGWQRSGAEGIPPEYAYIIPSGLCTAIVIPTTTLMYMLLKSVMVAMVIMRASVIVISRLVDEVQIRQGILKKTVYWQENAGVVFAVAAAATQIFLAKSEDFDFLHNPAAMTVLCTYISAYSVRIYIMNYYKNTRPAGAPLNNKWFFAIEQIAASVAMLVAAVVVYNSASTAAPVAAFQAALASPHAAVLPANLAGAVYGMVAFFSVFIFMFKGRTATFAGLVNRLTSLVAGTTATLVSYFLFKGRFPSVADWASLALILVAVGFLSMSERRRVAELVSARELDASPKGVPGAKLASIALLLAFAAASASAAAIPVESGKAFRLRQGETASIDGGKAELRLVKFINSPCPEGARCIWSGQAVITEMTVKGKVVTDAKDAPYDVTVASSDFVSYADLSVQEPEAACKDDAFGECLRSLARRRSAPALCRKIANERTRGLCLEDLAEALNKDELCAEVADPVQHCLFLRAKKAGDLAECARIGTATARDRCFKEVKTPKPKPEKKK